MKAPTPRNAVVRAIVAGETISVKTRVERDRRRETRLGKVKHKGRAFD